MADLYEDELASVVFWTYVVNSTTQHVMTNELTSIMISNKQIEQTNIKNTKIWANQQKYTNIDMYQLMFHRDQQVECLEYQRVHHHLHQWRHLHRAR